LLECPDLLFLIPLLIPNRDFCTSYLECCSTTVDECGRSVRVLILEARGDGGEMLRDANFEVMSVSDSLKRRVKLSISDIFEFAVGLEGI
jgi:hypothetical protein